MASHLGNFFIELFVRLPLRTFNCFYTMAMMNRSNNNSRRVYVGNLPSNVEERDLEDIFYKYGEVADVDLKIPRQGTQGTPFAFVEFNDPRYEYRSFAVFQPVFNRICSWFTGLLLILWFFQERRRFKSQIIWDLHFKSQFLSCLLILGLRF